MMTMKVMALIGGMSVAGYMYFKKHPEKIQQLKEIGKDASYKMFVMLNEE